MNVDLKRTLLKKQRLDTNMYEEEALAEYILEDITVLLNLFAAI